MCINITYVGQIAPLPQVPCFVLIKRALRDEGTSAHYRPPAPWSHLAPTLLARLTGAFDHLPAAVLTGASWRTGAPYRETKTAIDGAARAGAVCVEMEAAGLYAYAYARSHPVLCFAHITNTMATAGDDFEKGIDNGVHDALEIISAAARALAP